MRILALDDEAPALRRLEESIHEAAPSAELISCDTYAKAKEISEGSSFDVAFLDIHIAAKNGIELAKHLKSANPGINIVFTTGYGQYAVDAFEINASGYIMKPITASKIANALDNLRYPVASNDYRVKIVCFGNFEVFVDDEPIKFTSLRTKELLAYLVDRKGAMVSSREAMAILWEDDDHVSYLKKLRKDLIDSFKAYGIYDLIEISRGALGINLSKLYCDYADWLVNGDRAASKYNGEYMSQYSWAEATNAELRARMYGW